MAQASRFATLLARPGFNPANVRHEIQASVEHGPIGAPDCRGDDGVLALLGGRELGWALRPEASCAGFVEAAWIVAWSVEAAVLTVGYQPPPVHVHLDTPFRVEVRQQRPQLLQVTADPSALADFVARATDVLSPPPRS